VAADQSREDLEVLCDSLAVCGLQGTLSPGILLFHERFAFMGCSVMSAPLKKGFLIGITALALGGAFATTPSPAEAQIYYGYGYQPAGYYYGNPYGYYGYRPAYRYGYGYPYYYRRRSSGGAVAAGLIGGFALGALAATAARPSYYYPTRYRYRDCIVERRRVVLRSGRVAIRRVRTCY
jgi:hypothetical protein